MSMDDADLKTMLRKQRCRGVARTAALAIIIGLGMVFTGLNFVQLRADGSWWMVAFGGYIYIIGMSNAFALYGNDYAQRLSEILGNGHSGESAVWNEPWYNDVTPYQSLSAEQAVFGDSIEQAGDKS